MTACELEVVDEVETAPSVEPEAETETQPPEAPARRSHRWRRLLVILAACVCLAAGFFVTTVATSPARLEPLPVGFDVQQRSDYLLLTWNANAQAIREASRATLSIQDGPETEDVELNLAALRWGRLRYDPIFGNVRFRLSLTTASRRAVSEEARIAVRP